MDAGFWGVLVALGIGLASLWATIWSVRTSGRQAERQRHRERVVDSHIRILVVAEKRTRAYDERIYNQRVAEEIESGLRLELQHPDPPRSDLAEMDALIAAFASAPVRKAHALWEDAVIAVEDGFDEWGAERRQLSGIFPDSDNLVAMGVRMRARLMELELAVREEVGGTN